MKIYAILDHRAANKTFLGVAEELKKRGHEVQVDMYYDIEKANWCDVIFGEYIQGGIIHALKDESMKKPIVARGVDIDIYFGHFLGVDLNRCKSVLFINDYMKDLVLLKCKGAGKEVKVPVEVVHLGVDLDKFTYRERKAGGKQIGWLSKIWSGKGIELLCQLIYKLVQQNKEFKFDIVGKIAEPWVGKYMEEFIKRNNLDSNVNRIESVVDVNDWMEKQDYMLSTSMKECMSLPMIEAMAKGIKPIIHHWWDAAQLYPKELVWEGIDDAIKLILEDSYDSNAYREHAKQFDMKIQVDKLEQHLTN